MTASLEYEIRVSGVIPEAVLVEMEGVTARLEPVQTVLRGPVRDQAALHGIINRLQRLGLDLIEVRRIPSDPVDKSAGDSGLAAADIAEQPTGSHAGSR